MDGYWSRFAAGGDPNGGGAVGLAALRRGERRVLLLDDSAAAGSGIRAAQCDFWDTALRPLVAHAGHCRSLPPPSMARSR